MSRRFFHNFQNIIKLRDAWRDRLDETNPYRKAWKRETREQGQTSSSDDVREHSRTTRFNSSSFCGQRLAPVLP